MFLLNDRTDISSKDPEIDQPHGSPQSRVGAETNEILVEDPEQEERKKRSEIVRFFRIWFGLRRAELVKTAIGSIAAGFSGISKPVFGYFIITIGVAYYHKDAKRKVGWYSIAFSAIGLVSLVSHILQHYYYGMVGEKAMINLRKALFSGSCPSFFLAHFSTLKERSPFQFDAETPSLKFEILPKL